jgi:hypothetical protein
MNQQKRISLVIIISLIGISLACSINLARPGNNEQEVAEAVKAQLTVQAVQAAQTAIYLGQTQTAAAQAQAVAEMTRQAAAAAKPDPNAPPTPTPCNLPKFQSETVPDGTEMNAGQHFAKTWRVKNIGSCTWRTSYRLVFVTGDRMGGQTSQALAHEVAPGEAIDLMVDLTAPAADGDYKGFWKIQSNEGEQFGNYWVQIRVGPPPAAFAVTSVNFDVHPNIDMACPNDVSVKAEIRASAGGKVTYKWKDNAGGSSSTKAVTFSGAGSKIVDYQAHISLSGDYEASLYIDAPNHQWFGPVDFHVNCTP